MTENEKYETTILQVVQVIKSANVNQTNKSEFFGYFLDRLIHRYTQIPPAKTDQFNAHLFPVTIKKSLEMLSDRLATAIGSSDPMEVANDLRYVINSVLEQILPSPTSGNNLFLKGCFFKVMNKIDIASDHSLGQDNKDRIMASRRRIVALGVLSHISNLIN